MFRTCSSKSRTAAADRNGPIGKRCAPHISIGESTLIRESETVSIPGYGYAQPGTAHSPVSLDELRQIEMSAGWSDEDARVLRRHGDIFKNRAEQMVDAWRAVMGAQPHLAKWFGGPDGKPDDEY